MDKKITGNKRNNVPNEDNYYRIGSQYYKKICHPIISEEKVIRLKSWISEDSKLPSAKDAATLIKKLCNRKNS